MASNIRHAAAALLLMAFVLTCVTWLAQADAWAAGGATRRTAQDLRDVKEAVAVLAPLGVSPFYAMAGLGLAAQFGLIDLPLGLVWLGHPVTLACLVVAGLLLHLGRSFKITKPVAESAGVGESILAVGMAIAMAAPRLMENADSATAEAGVVDGLLLLTAMVSALVAIVVLRTALDIMIWLSPVPFIDGLFQAAKMALTGFFIVLAVLAPTAAVALNALFVLMTVFMVRWAVRVASQGLQLAYNLLRGRISREEAMATGSATR